MPFLLIAALLIAALASSLAAADAAPPRELPRSADADAAPITPGGGIAALRTTAAIDRGDTNGRPAGYSAFVPVAVSSAPAAIDTDTATPRNTATDASIRLTPRTRDPASPLGQGDELPSADEQRERGRSTWIATTVGGLGIALGAFLLLAWMIRRSMPPGLRPLPSEAVEVLGRAALSGRQQLHMLRFANKLVLVSTTPSGDTISLAEIEDTDEVNRVVALCRRHDPESSSESFRHLLQQFGQEPTGSGFVDAAPSLTTPSGTRWDRSERGTT
jgi:flagellar biogenesis protein FliO